MNLSRWSLNEIATVMDHLVLDVPTELSDHALHGFMNELGRDLFGRFQAPTVPAQEIDGLSFRWVTSSRGSVEPVLSRA